MIAVDTNILVRYAVKDDRKQTAIATEYLKSTACFVLRTVVLELAWVLSSQTGYHLTRAVVAERLRHLYGLPTITVEDADAVSQAITWFELGMDFADALHLASSTSCSGFATMDHRMATKAGTVAVGYKVLAI